MKATIGDLIYYKGEESEPACFGVVSSIKKQILGDCQLALP